MYFEQRVKSVQAVVLRTRTVFLIANLATLVSFASLFNTYGSWIRHLPERASIATNSDLHKAIVQAQVSDLMVVSVPVLGLKFFAADLGIVSSFGMLILSVWLYYSFRREQHSVARIILDVADQLDENPRQLNVREDRLNEATYLLNELSAVFVFITSEKDRAIGDRKRELYPQEGPPIAVWAKNRLLEGPFWVVLVCGIADFFTLALPSVIGAPGESLWHTLSRMQQIEAVGRIVVAIIMAFFIRGVLARAEYFFHWTQIFYRELGRAIAAKSSASSRAT